MRKKRIACRCTGLSLCLTKEARDKGGEKIKMNGKKGRRIGAAVCLALLLGLTGCGSMKGTAREAQAPADAGIQTAESGWQAGTESESTAVETEVDGMTESAASDRGGAGPAMRGNGELLYASGLQPLEEEQERLILDYMNLYFASLEDFEPEEKITSLFSDGEQAELADSAIDFQISLRQMQDADYTLASWSYVLTLSEITQQEDGSVHIFAREDSVQNFNQNPETASERYGGFQQFELEEVDGTWKIRSHMMFDAVYMMLWSEGGGEEAALRYAQAVPEYLERAQEAQLARQADRDREPEELQAQNPYDRQAAAAYADRYVDERNDAWPDYAGSGGNCQNYASQVLLAGGIPMDIYGDAVWKWYSDEVSNGPGAQGRSSSWTGVDQFVEYAAANTGYGLTAETEAPYFSGEPGDLLHMGIDGDWGHTVVIASAVTDPQGEVVDYLVDSNTGNLRNYPASLYGYPEIILTRIGGWNEG
ncbi:MAG TPA: amidase domain-containing protein [Candidatus Eisenbergiella merdipullorum]|uniref:Amidase domain-containing protein n=1 Tax=Candidatus Eisenbergiella merdipullorum TaxID=2838553 RepID=A0A9D2I283_9FIRM|nr:amidase domain-containing protein [Candidatus Eisenbergiella merdipullorum]